MFYILIRSKRWVLETEEGGKYDAKLRDFRWDARDLKCLPHTFSFTRLTPSTPWIIWKETCPVTTNLKVVKWTLSLTSDGRVAGRNGHFSLRRIAPRYLFSSRKLLFWQLEYCIFTTNKNDFSNQEVTPPNSEWFSGRIFYLCFSWWLHLSA